MVKLYGRWSRVARPTNCTMVALVVGLTLIGQAPLATSIGAITSYLIYIASILLKQTRPPLLAWSIFALSYGFWFVTQLAKGAPGGLWLISAELLGVVTTLTLAKFYHGTSEFGWTEWGILGGVIAALIVWLFTKSLYVSIGIELSVELVAYANIAIVTFKSPGEESRISWWWVVLTGVTGLFAVGSSPLVFYTFPALVAVGAASTLAADSLGAHYKVSAKP